MLVAYSGNFSKQKKGKYGFYSKCKQCEKQYREEHKDKIVEYKKWYRKEHEDKITEKKKQYYEEHKDEILEYQKQWREEHKEEKREYNEQYREKHKEELSEYQKQYREEHKEELLEYFKKYRKENKEKIKEKNELYYRNNKEEISKKQKKYHKNNPHIAFNATSRRREKIENQGGGITKEQWLEMMCWFDWCCAYSNKYIGGDSKHRTVDHIVPLDVGGLNEIWNCIPCFDSYNYSKHTSNMEEWYKRQDFFLEERLQKIYEWIEYAYDKWGNK